MFEGWSSLSVLLLHKEQTEEVVVKIQIKIATEVGGEWQWLPC